MYIYIYIYIYIYCVHICMRPWLMSLNSHLNMNKITSLPSDIFKDLSSLAVLWVCVVWTGTWMHLLCVLCCIGCITPWCIGCFTHGCLVWIARNSFSCWFCFGGDLCPWQISCSCLFWNFEHTVCCRKWVSRDKYVCRIWIRRTHAACSNLIDVYLPKPRRDQSYFLHVCVHAWCVSTQCMCTHIHVCTYILINSSSWY